MDEFSRLSSIALLKLSPDEKLLSSKTQFKRPSLLAISLTNSLSIDE
tara:strand:+ start:44 stop:184 length:141 start_codon:yes stop_codon:yes gene_type:complete